MKRVVLLDNPAGNALGRDHNNMRAGFIISDPNAEADNSMITISAENLVLDPLVCHATSGSEGTFNVVCDDPVAGNSKLYYVITRLPPHVVS
jgi:hypothetical protein